MVAAACQACVRCSMRVQLHLGCPIEQVARALGCDDEDMDEAEDDAGGDADYGPAPREDDDDDDEGMGGGSGNGTTDAGADTDAAEAEGMRSSYAKTHPGPGDRLLWLGHAAAACNSWEKLTNFLSPI